MATKKIHLLDLPLECLFCIFEKLDANSLVNLYWTYPEIKNIIEEVAKRKTKYMYMVAHCDSSIFNKRSWYMMDFHQRLSIGFNWMKAFFIQRSYRRICRPKMILDEDYLYMTLKSTALRIKRVKSIFPGGDALVNLNDYVYLTNSDCEVSDFVKKDKTLFEVRKCGEAFIHEDNKHSTFKLHGENDTVIACDFSKQIYVSSSSYNTKLWVRGTELGMISLDAMGEYDEGYGVLCLSDDAKSLYACSDHFYTFNVETGIRTTQSADYEHFFQIQIKDPNTVLALSNHRLYMFDCRISSSAALLFHSSDMSCFDYDGANGLIMGMNRHHGIKLLDIRRPNSVVQSYHVRCNNIGVRSLACDSRYLFGHWGERINVLDFKYSY